MATTNIVDAKTESPSFESDAETYRTPDSSDTGRHTDPRLVIHQLVLTNFKSYGGRQVIGPFNASFSAVVGPNGSGKSNVIDSMLFVFGFRASKMRQGKLSELIHNSEGDRMDFCQVDIHFQHVVDVDDDIVTVPGELVVSRKAYKNNSSQYYINGKTSNYTQVTSLLREKGIDLDHKRFLILQGEVESIAQMKPKAEKENDDGLLEYLEDIIGTSHFKDLILQGLTKMEELNEICIEKSSRFDLVQKDKASLEDKKDEALEFLAAEKRLLELKSLQFHERIAKNTEKLTKVQNELNSLNESHQQDVVDNKHTVEILNQNQRDQKALQHQIDRHNKDINDLQHQQKGIQKKMVTLEEKIKNLNNKLKKAIKAKDSSAHMLASAKLKLSDEEAVSEQYHHELSQLSSDLVTEKAKLEEIRMSLTSKTSQYTAQIEQLTGQLEPWNDKLKTVDNDLKLIESSLEMLQQEKNVHQRNLEAARAKLIDIKVQGKQKEHDYGETNGKLDHITHQIDLGESQIGQQKASIDTAKARLDTHRVKVTEMAAIVNHHHNKNRVVSGLNRLAQSGRISGFYGRLGDLGVIDDKYDVAISTACPGLDSMVVETVDTAQACIQYLRSKNLGYANFICLEKLRKFNLSPISCPRNAQRLFDLIDAKETKFLPAFYSKLFDTLVTTNLQEARQVAYGPKRFRVVTLDGKLVDTSGTMSGGGTSFTKGAMTLRSQRKIAEDIDENELEGAQKQLAAMESEYEAMVSDYRAKLDQLNGLKALKPEIEIQLSRLNMEIESLSTEKREVSNLIKELVQNEDDNSEVDTKIHHQQQLQHQQQQKRAELKHQMKDLEHSISQMEEKIMEAGGVELRLQKSKIDSINQKMEIVTEKSSSDKINKRKLENDIKKHDKLIAEVQQEIQQINHELESHQSTNYLHDLEVITEKLQTLQDETAEVESQLNDLQQTHKLLQSEVNQFKSRDIEYNNQCEQLSGKVQGLTRAINDDTVQIERLVPRDYLEYINWLPQQDQAPYITPVHQHNKEGTPVHQEVEELQEYIKNKKIDIEVLKEYGEKLGEYQARQTELGDALANRDEIKAHCEELKRKRLEEFMAGFNAISLSLKEMYQMITMGGNAELELVDSLDPFSEGILFSVMPPKKSWKNISNLSGGEKTLSSLALVFALHKYKPTPLYVMDEIDAALDFRNVSIVANYIKERTKNGQFIVISLRNNMFELAKQLVGIYKVNNRTRSISLLNKDFFTVT